MHHATHASRVAATAALTANDSRQRVSRDGGVISRCLQALGPKDEVTCMRSRNAKTNDQIQRSNSKKGKGNDITKRDEERTNQQKREDGKGDEEGETRRTKIRRSNVN